MNHKTTRDDTLRHVYPIYMTTLQQYMTAKIGAVEESRHARNLLLNKQAWQTGSVFSTTSTNQLY